MEVRRAEPHEAVALTALALRSKGMWGYSKEFLECCRAELTIHAGDVLKARAHVAVDGGSLLGFFTVTGEPPAGDLDCLYVEPHAVGRGVGRALLDAAMRVAQTAGFRRLAIHSDPQAEGFYLKCGAVRIGDVASGSIPGRMLPLLELGIGPRGCSGPE